MNLFDLFIKIGVDDQASSAIKNMQKNVESLTNKTKNMGSQFDAAEENVGELSKKLIDSAQKTDAASKEAKELAKNLDDTGKEAEEAGSALDKVNKKLEETKERASKSRWELSGFAEKLGNGLKTASKIGASSIVTVGAIAIKTFSDFEQLAGGAELMFGDAFESVMENAKNAYKTVQMSQNEYLRQVNGFATGLKTALDGNEQAAADLAHRIIKAEADIIAATGNTAENVQNAFNGIMKSNFTMLDNLQIGITPTKEGFQEVIDKVNEWNAANGAATEYQMGNLADMQSALVDYIEMVGMSGYAQNEAAGTILGSFASMKAAASDFATALIDENGDVDGSFNKLKETAFTFFDNLKPRIMEFLEAISPIATTVGGITGAFVAFKSAASISALINTLVVSFQAYQKANESATVAQWLMNAAMNANPIVLIVTLIGGLVAAIVTLWNTNDDFKNALIGAWDAIKNAAVVAWEGIVKFFKEDIPNAFNSVIKFVKNNWQSLLAFITNPIAGALSLLYDLNPKFKEWVDNVWQSIKNGFNNIVSSALNWGKDLIDNFIGGIKEKWNNLKNTVKDVAQSIKDLLGFSEPKEGPLSNFHTYAPDMMDLFAQGIRENEHVITDQIEKSFDFGERTITAAYNIKADGTFGTGAQGGAFAPQVTVNINGADHIDARTLAQEAAEAVSRALQNMTERRAAVYG